MVIKNVNDSGFEKYGRVLKEYNFSDITRFMEDVNIPQNVIYEPSIEGLESLESYDKLKDEFFGGLQIQIGYCNGNNYVLNAVEYHRSSEINIAVTDLIILIGSQQDIEEDYTYETSKIEAFLVPAGTAIELYATTLHFAPCNAVEYGFKCVVVLPRDTNLDLEKEIKKEGENSLLFARNKWLIAHKDSKLDDQGAFIGLKGKNISIK